MPGRTQNHPEMPRNLKVLRLKMQPCAKTAVFCRVILFTLFLLPFFRHFWWISTPFGLPRSKRRWSVLGNFLLFFGFFFGFDFCCNFGRFFLPKATKNVEKNDEKTSLTTNLATSSYHQPHHQRLTNEASRVDLTYPWHPHPPFQVNGRAVVPALPVQFNL